MVCHSVTLLDVFSGLYSQSDTAKCMIAHSVTDSVCCVTTMQKEPQRYMEDKLESGPNFEQKRWEEEHLHAALLKFGAKDAKSASKVLLLWHLFV